MDNPYRQKILKAIQKLGQVHSVWDVFSDFVELGALCIANSITGYSTSFCYVNSIGGANISNASNSNGVCFGFCI